MIKKFHSIDRHKRSSMISILNREGKEDKLFSTGVTINSYLKSLDPEDAVVMETGISN